MNALHGLLAALLALVVGASASAASAPSRPSPAVLQALAPTGKLRVGLYLGGPASIVRGATLEDSKGVGFDLGKELARRMGVAFEPVVYPTPGDVLGGLKAGEWDISLLALTAERQRLLSFTAPLLTVEDGYLAPAGSPISDVEAVDRPGNRIGAPQGGAVNAILARTIKHATVVPVPSFAAAAEMLKSGKLDVFAAGKPNLFELSDRMPGSRVLDGRIGTDEYAIALPKGREAGLRYLQQYLDNASAEGLIKAAIERAKLRGAVDKLQTER
jgi:polar amino acid transport system substrate-binding protein